MRERLVYAGIFQNVRGHFVHVLLFIVAGAQRNQQIQIADRLFSAAQRTGRRNRLHNFFHLADIGDQLPRLFVRDVQLESAGRALGELGGLQYVGLGFFAEAFQIAQLAFARERFHALDGGDLEFLEQDRHFLRSHALQMQQIEQRQRIFFQ